MFKYLLLVIVLFNIGCKNNTSLKETSVEKVIYKPEKEKGILESSLIKEIKLIPLETLPDCLLDVFTLKRKNTDYYLVDYFRNKSIFRFNKEGKFLNRIGHPGNGPEEYPELSDYFFDSSGNIMLYSGPAKSVYYYSLEGDFKEKIQFNQHFHKAINDNENNHWLYTGHSNEQGKSLLTKVNNKGEVLFQGVNKEYNIISFPEVFPVFSNNNLSILMRQSFSQIIYSLKDTLFLPIYEFDFGHYNIPDEFYYKNSLVEAGEVLFARDYAIINKMITNDNYLLTEFIIHKQKSAEFTIAYGIKNKDKKEWKWFEIDSNLISSHILAGTLHQLSENDEIIGIVDAWKLKEWENRAIFVNPEIIDQLKEDDNPVIMICTLNG